MHKDLISVSLWETGCRFRRRAKRLTKAGKAVNKAFLQSSLLDGHNRERNRKRSTKQDERR
jgi:hypothetical protein